MLISQATNAAQAPCRIVRFSAMTRLFDAFGIKSPEDTKRMVELFSSTSGERLARSEPAFVEGRNPDREFLAAAERLGKMVEEAPKPAEPLRDC